MAVSKTLFDPKMKEILANRTIPESVLRRLESQYTPTPYEGLGEVVPAFVKELRGVKSTLADDGQWQVPAAELVLDRYTLRDENRKADPSRYVKVVLPYDSDFKPGEIFSKEKFEAVVDAIKEKGQGTVPPTSVNLVTASGHTNYASVTLLPSIQFTVPLLLLAASIWFAWRVVNMPMFADFLIATEAELNKVSWTTQRRLIQDTIVVLVTVVLMTLILLVFDQLWGFTFRFIGVLPPAKAAKDKTTQVQSKLPY